MKLKILTPIAGSLVIWLKETRGADVNPVHAHGFIMVSMDGVFNQILCFDYHDPLGYYASIMKDKEAYERDMERLIESMQSFLDEETVKVNGIVCRPEVITASLDFRGSENLPCITFFIQYKARIKGGLNVYECLYRDEEVEYDYEVYWIFPSGVEVIEVETYTRKDLVTNNLLILWARCGDRTGGYERISFNVPKAP